ncbi:hypothetical protein SAMN05192549_106423 [Duganella sacchari]|uniref:Uncharacterized protein n=1 Tax=Duganella sacchari TaxID=551987 RepID=A0A1M7QA27_9BURK|nr:hypothetical protein SAMN05192549_106423 [Duganella sacchari]
MDFIFLAATLLFYAVTVAMAAGCDKLGGQP